MYAGTTFTIVLPLVPCDPSAMKAQSLSDKLADITAEPAEFDEDLSCEWYI